MTNILLSLSLGLNLIFCALLVNLSYNTIFNLDQVRSDFLADMRFQTHKACMAGHLYTSEVTEGYNPESLVEYCAKWVESSEENFMYDMFNLGRKGH